MRIDQFLQDEGLLRENGLSRFAAAEDEPV